MNANGIPRVAPTGAKWGCLLLRPSFAVAVAIATEDETGLRSAYGRILMDTTGVSPWSFMRGKGG